MAGYDAWHWRAFTVMIRLFGIASVVVGCAFALDGSPWVGMCLLLLGLPFLLVRPYRPDLGDVERLVSPKVFTGNDTAPRHWWTGDRKRSAPPR